MHEFPQGHPFEHCGAARDGRGSGTSTWHISEQSMQAAPQRQPTVHPPRPSADGVDVAGPVGALDVDGAATSLSARAG
jgi:hypothetical protein